MKRFFFYIISLMDNDKLNKLRNKILIFNAAYEKGEPIVEDIVYDFYKKKLLILEQKQNLKISEYIGSTATNDPSPHLFPILSLDHNFGADSIEKFIKKIEKSVNPFPLVAELKIDGISLIARYENGKITALKTRGNGFLGENISAFIPFLNIPDHIHLLDTVEIRFEAYFDKNIIKNPRNAVAGILLKKNFDPMLSAIHLAPHNLYSKTEIWNSYKNLRKIFEAMHLECIQPFAVCDSLKDCLAFFKTIDSQRKNLSHEIDGVVFKVDSKLKQDLLGNTAKAPKFAFAVKFANSYNISEILNIEFQVGRQGRLSPLATVTTTEINNRKISKATLNNLKDLEKKKYAIGDIVKIEMAGDVIPKITDIVEKSKINVHIPNVCPSCGTILQDDLCTNNWNCFEQKLNKLIYFASKQCLNIKNFGTKQIEFFVKQNVLNYPFDFFELKNNIEKISYKPSWLAEKFFANIVKSIEKSKYTTLEKFVISLGLPNIAKSKTKEICNKFNKFEDFLQAGIEDLKFLGANNAINVYEYKKKESFWIEKTFYYMKINESYNPYSLFNF